MRSDKHIVSKERVANHGEVYTPQRVVNAMVDLVGHEPARIESRFLEPACGTGNFLAEILERKLRVVERRYGKSQLEYERNAVLDVVAALTDSVNPRVYWFKMRIQVKREDGFEVSTVCR